MPLWGTEDTAGAKPQIGGRAYNAEKAREIFATAAGWSQVGAGRNTTGKQHELLVAMRGLSTVLIGGTGAGDVGSATEVKASITSMNWNISTYSRAAGGTIAAGTALSISANFNEAVTVTGNPTFLVVNDSRTNHVLAYRSALSTANRVTFTLPIGASNNALQATDVLTIVADAISLAGGAIYDTVSGAGTAAVYANHVDIGTAAGSITVT